MHDQKLIFPSAVVTLLLLFFATTSTFIQPTTAIEASPFNSGPPYTVQQCNFTAYPKNGCEDDLGAECVGEGPSSRCRCKSGFHHLVDGRFCLRQACPPGQYFDAYENVCMAQRRASSQVAESHCRYDYHCFGPHVRCRLYGWNRNCVCNPGFIYGYNGTCIPLHGIGGHCSADADCDQTGTRKMFCQATGSSSSGSSSSESAIQSSVGSGGSVSGGTCQCMADHTYNYQVDGCESNERIRERKNNMRTLILLFVLCATVFGFALTFNFGLFGSPSRAQHAMLLKRLAMEKERQERAAKEAEEGTAGGGGGSGGSSPSAPPVDGVGTPGAAGEEKQIMIHGADDGRTTNGILVVDLDMVDDDVDEQKKNVGNSSSGNDNNKPSSRLISLY